MNIFLKGKNKYIALIAMLIIAISLSFAFLSYSLRINGNVDVDANTWIIYFDDVVEKDNNIKEVEAARIVDFGKTIIDFSLELGKVGDTYKFTVDTVNDGTIDAMIDSIESTDFEKYKDYLDFTVTYDNLNELQRCDPLYSPETAEKLDLENRRHLIVTINYKKKLDIEKDELLKLRFAINYIQLDDTCPVPSMHKLTIDPNTGTYDGKTENTEVYLNEGQVYTLMTPLKDRHKLTGWTELTETDSLDGSIVTMGDADVYVQANWEFNIDAVCKVMRNYRTSDEEYINEYETIQECFDTAENNDSVVMINNTIETATLSNKTIEYDLAGYRVEGQIINNGNMTIINTDEENSGIIENLDGAAYVNKSVLNLGENDGSISIDNIQLIGSDIGLINQGYFNFYDGFIEGITAFTGGYNDTPLYKNSEGEDTGIYYYPFIDHNNIKDCERAYLADKDRAVAKTVTNESKDIYFYNLQDSINFATVNDYENVFIVRDFEAGYPIEVKEGKTINVDLKGYKVETGYDFVNNGNLTITSTEPRGKLLTSLSIINNYTSSLNISNISVETTTNIDTVINYGDIVIDNAQLSSPDKNVLKNTKWTVKEIVDGKEVSTVYNATATIKGNSVLKTDGRAIIHDSNELLNITGGLIYGIRNDTLMNISGDTTVVYVPTDDYAIINNGEMNIDDIVIGTIDVPLAFGIINNNKMIINDGEILIRARSTMYNTTSRAFYSNSKNGVINYIKIDSSYDGFSGSGDNKLIINNSDAITSGTTINGTVEINDGTYESRSGHVCYTGTIYLNNGTLKTTNTDTLNRCTINMKSGLVKSNTTAVNDSNVTISGGNIVGTNYGVLNSTLTQTGGLISSDNYGVYISDGRTVNINLSDTDVNEDGLQVKAIDSGKVGIYSNNYYNNITVNSGLVYGNLYGVQNVNGNFTVGKDDGTILLNPQIMGESYSIYITGGSVNFYDGELIGIVDAHYGIITSTPIATKIVKNGQIINETNYHVETLASIEPFIRVDDETFTSIDDAAEYIYDNGGNNTMYLMRDVDISFAQSFPVHTCRNANNKEYLCGAKIVFDLDGHTITSSQSITNYNIASDNRQGITLDNYTSIINSGDDKNATFVNGRNMVFVNYGTLKITGIKFDNPNQINVFNKTTTDWSATTELNNVDAVATNQPAFWSRTGTITYNSGKVNATTNVFRMGEVVNYMYYYGDLVINDIDLTGTETGATGLGRIVVNNGTIRTDNTTFNLLGSVTVNNGQLSSLERIVYIDSNTTVNGGVLNAKKDAIYVTEGSATVTGGTIISKEGYGVYTGGYGYVSGGQIIGTIGFYSGHHYNGYGSRVCSNTTIVDGDIIGTESYGVYGDCGIITVGIDEDTPIKPDNGATGIPNVDYDLNSTSWPEIIGVEYGVYLSESDFSFFDGVLKGQKAAHNGMVTLVPDGAMVQKSENDIDGYDISVTNNKIYNEDEKWKNRTGICESSCVLSDLTYYDNTHIESLNGHYEFEYLVPQDNFLEVNGVLFNSINRASNYAGNNNTINVIKDVSIAFGGNLGTYDQPYNNQKFNLNGHTLIMTQPIHTYGSTIFDDTSEDDIGYLHNVRNYAIYNHNTITIKDGKYQSDRSNALITEGTANVIGGLLISKNNNTIYGKGELNYSGTAEINNESYNGISFTGTINYTGGSIDLNSNTCISGSGTLNISGGTIKNKQNGVIYNGAINIDDGADIQVENGYAVTNNAGTLTINGGYIYSKNEAAIEGNINGSYYTYINGGDIISENKNAIVLDDYSKYYGWTGNVYVRGGNVIGGNYGIYHSAGPLYVTGGNVIGKGPYGIYVTGVESENRNPTTIGDNDENISQSNPMIKGSLYGLYINQESNVNFYDGILKGQTYGYRGIITNIPERSSIFEDSEWITETLIDPETNEEYEEDIYYKTNYIVGPQAVIRNVTKSGRDGTDVLYDDFKIAVDEAENNDQFELINHLRLFEPVNITCKVNKNDGSGVRDCYADELKKIRFDLKDYSIITNKAINLNMDLELYNTGSENSSKITTSSSVNLITNNGKLSIDNIYIENNATNNYVITNNYQLKLSNLSILANYGVRNYSTLEGTNINIINSTTSIDNRGKLTLSGANLNASSYAIYNNTNSDVKVDNSTLRGGTALYSIGITNVKVNNSTLVGAINNTGNSIMTLDGDTIGDINSTTGISNTSILTINNSSFKYTTYGVRYCSNEYAAISNTNNLTIRNTNIEVEKYNYTCGGSKIYGISNTSRLEIIDSKIDVGNINNSYNNYGAYYGIYDNGNTNLILSDTNYDEELEYENSLKNVAPTNPMINVEGGGTNCGIYINNANSNVTMISGQIKAMNAYNNSYGVYVSRGNFTLGEMETDESKIGTADAVVSNLNPYIYAVGKTRGYGLRKINGFFNYYDGRIVGSTAAKPDTLSEVEYKYEATTYLNNKNYEYTILEYMKDDYSGSTVAKINSTYYPNLESAIEKANNGDTIILLKNTIEKDLDVNKNITIDLGGHRVTTSINNTGNLTLINGIIGNYDKTAIVNKGTLTLGINDGIIDNESGIISENVAIINRGTLNYYDGYIEGTQAVDGVINRIASNTRVHSANKNDFERKTLELVSDDNISNRLVQLNVTIDPFDGYYLNSKNIVSDYYYYGDEILLEDPVKTGCIFTGWEITYHGLTYTMDNGDVLIYDSEFISENYGELSVQLDGTLFTVGAADVVITATWEVDPRSVARINNDYFLTIEAALEDATDGEEIVLLKDINQDLTINENTNGIINMDKHAISGSIVNNGTITLDNGSVISDDIAIVNNGTLTLGKNDGEVFEENIYVYGKNIALSQKGIFNFYDGKLQGELGILGGANAVPRGNYLYVDQTEDGTEQIVYLVGAAASFVAATYENGSAYYFNLQDAINSASINNYEIFILRDFDVSYPITISESQSATININGYKVNLNSTFINNGSLTIKDTSDSKGVINKLSTQIINNGEMIVDGSNINSNDNFNLINNVGSISVINGGKITTTTKSYAVANSGEIEVDDSSYLKSSGRALYTSVDLTINSGNISGITNDANLTLSGVVVATTSDYAAIYNNKKVIMEGGSLSSASGHGVYNNAADAEFYLVDGTISGTVGCYNNGVSSKFIMDNGTVTGTSVGVQNVGNSSKIIINDGIVRGNSQGLYDGTSNSTSVLPTMEVNGGDIYGNYNGIYNYYDVLTINGGYIHNNASSTSIGYSAIYAGAWGSVIMNGGTIEAPNSYALYSNSGLNIRNGKIISKRGDGLGIYADYTLNMTGGTIETTGSNSNALYLNPETAISISGGKIISNGNGIYYSGGSNDKLTISNVNVDAKKYGIQITNGKSVYLGSDDGDIKNVPYIKGDLYGVYVSSGYLYFYDGIIKGKTDAMNGNPYSTPRGYSLVRNNEEVIIDPELLETETYIVGTLETTPPYLKVNDEEFNSMADAINYISEELDGEGEIDIISNAIELEGATIPSTSDIVIDFNGHELKMTHAIINNGKLRITDNSDDGNYGKLINGTSTLFGNNNELVFENITATTTGGYGVYTETRKSKFTMESGTIVSNSMTYYANNYDTTIIVNGGKLQSNSDRAIYSPLSDYNQTRSTVIINDGELIGAINAIYARVTNVTINGGLLKNTSSTTSTSYATLFMYYDCMLNMTGGTVISDNAIAVYLGTYTYSHKISGGTIISNRYDGTGIYCENGLTMTGGTVRTTGTSSIGIHFANQYNQDKTISGARVESADRGIYVSSGTLHYNEGKVNARNAAFTVVGGTANINDGEFTGGTGLYVTGGTTNVKDGSFVATTYGLNQTGGTVNLGENDNIVKTDTPYFKGNTRGVNVSGGVINFYDGKFRSANTPYVATFNTIPNRYQVIVKEDEDDTLVTILRDTKTASTDNYSESPISEYAKEGNGYAKVTFMGSTDEGCNEVITYSYDYTGDEQTFTPVCNGLYKLETWGAQGGSASYNSNSTIGGYGAYASGEINLTTDDTLYINVGGKGNSVSYTTSSGEIIYDESIGYNGGGYAAVYINNSSHAGGGGATHIATASGLLSSLYNNVDSIIIVAGAGGGAGAHSSYPGYSGNGGSGGGFTGGNGVPTNNACYNYGLGGTQGYAGTYSYSLCTTSGTSGRNEQQTSGASFGKGANYQQNYSASGYAYSGGGAGYYGGGSGYHGPGAGGSGYVNSSNLQNGIMYGYQLPVDESYNVGYLAPEDDFLRVGLEDFNNFEDAINYIETNYDRVGEIVVIEDKNISTALTIPKDDDITINLNGHTISTTLAITNNGTLTFTDSKSGNEVGSLIDSKSTLFVNNGTLNLNKINVTATGGHGVYTTSSGTVFNMNSGTLISNAHTVYYNGVNNTFNMNGGVVKSNSNIAYYCDLSNTSNPRNKVNVEGGEIIGYTYGVRARFTDVTVNNGLIKNTNSNSNYALECHYDSTCLINGGKILSPEARAVYISYYSYGSKVTGGEIISNRSDGYGIVADNGVTITGGKIETTGSSGIGLYIGSKYNYDTNVQDGTIISNDRGIYENAGVLNVTGGSVESRNAGITIVGGTLTDTGGTVDAGTYGIYQTAGTLTIGKNDDTIDSDSPMLKGNLYGLYRSGGTANYFDGTLKGISNPYNGNFNSIPLNSEITYSVETIDDKNYKIAKITEVDSFIVNTNSEEEYNNLQTAVDEALDGDTLEFKKDYIDYNSLTIPQDKILTINFKGYNYTYNSTTNIVNKGELKLIDSENRTTLTKSFNGVFINNQNQLHIENIYIFNKSDNYAIYNSTTNSSLVVKNLSISGNYGIRNAGSLTATNLNDYTSNYGIYDESAKINKVTNSVISKFYIYNNSEYTFTNVNLAGESNLRLTTSKLTMNGGTSKGIIYNYGILELNNVNVDFEAKSTTNYYPLYNYNGGTLRIHDSNLKANSYINNTNYVLYLVYNDGTFYSNRNIYTLNSVYAQSVSAIYNVRTMETHDDEIVMEGNGSYTGIYTNTPITYSNLNIHGIGSNVTGFNYQSSSDFVVDDINIDVSGINTGTAYGFYNKGSNLTILGGTIIARNANNTYGLYHNSGVLTLGEEDGSGTASADVNKEYPLIAGLNGGSNGIGIKRAGGSFNYYDGKIAGNTNAKPENINAIEFNYEAILYYDSELKADYYVLEYIKGASMVAEINGTYYQTLYDAIKNANNGDVINLLSLASENVIVNKNITIDLKEFTINGSITNNKELTLLNGTIDNYNGIAIKNYGILTLGSKDDMVDDSIIVKGSTTGILQNGILKMYDGYVIGEQNAIIGNIDIVEDGYIADIVDTSEGNKLILIVDPENEDGLYDYGYTGTYQEFIAPEDGIYKFELWGAQGNNVPSLRGQGGHGAYTSGEIYLTEGTKIYIYVGEHRTDRNASFNAGSTGGSSSEAVNGGGVNGYGGGGATDIRLVSGDWNNQSSLASRIMVAAGGGGASDYSYPANGGDAGALEGASGKNGKYPNAGVVNIIPTGGTQTNGGKPTQTSSTGSSGSFGRGGNGNSSWGSGGGGGYYGGAGGGYSSSSVDSGAGGSSYISGYTGSVAISNINNLNPRTDREGNICKDGTTDVYCSYHYSGYVFDNSTMLSGSVLIPNYRINNTSYGNLGSGHVKITKVESSGRDLNVGVQLVTGSGNLSNNVLIYQRGSEIGELPIPTRNGYSFEGWYYDNTYESAVSEDDEINNYTVLYAKWLISSDTHEFTYSGDYEEYIVPYDGYYEIELWGASSAPTSGRGAYTKGKIYLEKDSILYFYVGGSNGYNGGGSSRGGSVHGGGATDVRLVSGEWNDEVGLRSRIMVAAGGGSYGSTSNAGTHGGTTSSSSSSSGFGSGGVGSSQLGAGSHRAGFGYGGNGGSWSGGHGGAGGGGYYGGGGADPDGSGDDDRGGAGGSSYISGHYGSIALLSDESNAARTNYLNTLDDSYHYSGYIFTDTVMKSGGETMPAVLSDETMSGNVGNGHAVIKLIEKITYVEDTSIKNGKKYKYTTYNKDYHTFTVPADGIYTIELWGSASYPISGKGAYTKGDIYLTEGTNLYIYLGRNNGYNGGGSSRGGSVHGGGATDVRLVPGDWNYVDGLASRIMVAAGGGSYGASGREGTHGGTTSSSSSSSGYGSGGVGSSQLGAGDYRAGFGYGGDGGSWSGGHGGAGGGGYYGGGGANPDGSGDDDKGGAGGSSYISGHLGSIAIISPYRIAPVNDVGNDLQTSYHYSGYKFTNTQMISGGGVMPKFDRDETMTGNSGNGMALITIKELGTQE